MQRANLRNDELFRRFLSGERNSLRNHRNTVTTRELPDGTLVLEGYGHNKYAEVQPDGDVVIYTGNIEWAWDQWPEGKPGQPITVRHIKDLLDVAEQLELEYTEAPRAPKTAAAPSPVGGLDEIGHIGGWDNYNDRE